MHAKVMVVDDDRTIRMLLTSVLEKDGYQVIQAVNGQESVALAKEHLPDLILMDYMMPVMDGITACGEIRREGAATGYQPPIVMVTAAHDDESVKRAIEAGATDYLLKPIILPVLRQRVRTLVDGQRSEAVIRHMAYHDALTGLPNRVAFTEILEELLLVSRGREEEHVLCYVDLDQFKIVNDTCGHAAGDRLLVELTAMLKPTLRRDDVLARLGGDEFGVLIRHCPLETGRDIADKLRQSVADFRFISDGRVFHVGASIGIVLLNNDWTDVSSAMAAADSACYGAKERGRNMVFIYQIGEEAMAVRRSEMDWTTRIHTAMDEGRMRLQRQIIVPCDETRSDQCSHYEVLIYMIDEQGNAVPPGAFLPAAERYGLMPTIDRFVIENSLARIGQVSDCACDIHSINLSGASLSDEKLLGFIRNCMKKHGVAPQRICFEITESAVITHLASARYLIDQLREDGCRFYLDDFGSGMSSFGYLKNLPVDVIKLDGMFIRNMIEDGRDQAIVKAIHSVAQALKLETIAEYVESAEIMTCLRKIGVDYAQGFAIGRPEVWN
ncbi:MAG: EAL domain-containing protein [Rhodocyclaceae bacterium]|nr:EAL domain-containing protein [Rhodocyclaceae bacterium]